MIRWCVYCQKYIGEKEPYTDYALTHGACDRCYETEAYRGDPSAAMAPLRTFYAQLFTAGMEGRLEDAESMVAQAIDAGFAPLDVAMGFIQPALYEIGEKWARNEISFQDEHRFTAWCQRLLDLMPAVDGVAKERPDLLLLPAPGNVHFLGTHLVALALGAEGFDVRTERKALAAEKLDERIRAENPWAIGFSCALPTMVESALQECERLRQNGFRGRLLLGGLACRAPVLGAVPEDIVLCMDPSAAVDALR